MSFSHLLILGIIAVLVIPPEKLPEVARQVARFLGELRRMSSTILEDFQKDPGPQLKPEDNLKRYEQNSSAQNPAQGHPAQAPIVTPADEPPPSEEEMKAAEERYRQHIQAEAAAAEAAAATATNSQEQKKDKT